VLGSEQVDISFGWRTATIGNCQKMHILIEVKAWSNAWIQQTVQSARNITILPKSRDFISICYSEPLSKGRNYILYFAWVKLTDLLIDAAIVYISVENETSQVMVFSRKTHIGTIEDIREKKAWFAKMTYLSVEKALIPTKASQADDKPLKTTLSNEVTIYDDDPITKQLAEVVETYSGIWKDQGMTVNIPEIDYMTIPLKEDWKAGLLNWKVYPLGPKNRKLVNEKFDKMHVQSKMHWTKENTPFDYPVFVVWKTGYKGPKKNPIRKGCVVVNIHGLNKITEVNSYPIPLQGNIISAVQGAQYISTVDCTGFFHQWRVQPKDSHKLTVILHCRQKFFNVTVMGYKNSPAYVKRQIDILLRSHQAYVKVFIDDITISSMTLKDHIRNLHTIFSLFQQVQITLSSIKSFIEYSLISLLGQRVNSFKMTTSEEKIEVISNLDFSRNWKDLERYLGLTGWLCNYVSYYAQLTASLQRWKTLMNRNKTIETLSVSKAEEEFFTALQAMFAEPRFLTHFNSKRRMFVNLDAFKQWGFEAMIYHVKAASESFKDLSKISRNSVQPILFLSKLLASVETRYWPIKLKVAELVWMIWKIKHMVEAVNKPIIVQTDHSATSFIIRQVKLTTSFTDKLNLWLICASQYCSQFELDIRYKPGKTHIVPDALSRLSQLTKVSSTTTTEANSFDVLEEFHTDMKESYHVSLIELLSNFRKCLMKRYKKDDGLRKIQKMLKNNLEEGFLRISFRYWDGLLYYITDTHNRLVILKDLHQKVFWLAHDGHSHAELRWCYQKLSDSLYIHRMAHNLKAYLKHCLSCQTNQMKWHRLYGALRPITSLPIPFHTVTVDFITKLPKNREYNMILSVIDKFSKQITLLPENTEYSADQWAEVFLEGLTDWGVPVCIISDCDSKFLSAFWKGLFHRLDTTLLFSTAYHPQTDGQSEQTNQAAEIALCYHLTSSDNNKWVSFLLFLCVSLNNSANQSTDKSSTKLIYGFNLQDSVQLLNVFQYSESAEYTQSRKMNQREAADALAFAAVDAKVRYDVRHTPLLLQSGDKAYLCLHNEYCLSGVPNSKLSLQQVEPFEIVKRICNLAYQLKILSNWHIHNVIFVAQLELAVTEDSYNHLISNHSDVVKHSLNDKDYQYYEVKKVINQHKRRYGRRPLKMEYLLSWKGYGPEWDTWKEKNDLNCTELVEEYDNLYSG